MSSFSFIHAADIHLDSKLRGLEKYEGAPADKIRSATREAFKNLVNEAINRKVAFLLIAGDLYDGDWKDYNSGLFFTNQMSRLNQHNIPVFLIRGNHDAASIITKELTLPSNVIEFPIAHPTTHVIDELSVAIHGQSFANRSVQDNLVKNYPQRKEGFLNIGLLHTSATGSEEHDTYAPCSLDDLLSKGYDYWALGHIHKRHFLNNENPVILFPGNIQGRHIKETGNKGCTFITVEDGVIQSLEDLSLNVLQWELCEIDASGLDSIETLFNQVRLSLESLYEEYQGKFLAVRCVLSGSTKIHQDLIVNKDHIVNNIRTIAIEIGVGDIWVEKVKIKTTARLNFDKILDQDTPISFILDYITAVRNDTTMLEDLLSEFQDIEQKLPFDLKQGEEGFNFNDITLIKERLPQVESIILHYLTKKEEVSSS